VHSILKPFTHSEPYFLNLRKQVLYKYNISLFHSLKFKCSIPHSELHHMRTLHKTFYAQLTLFFKPQKGWCIKHEFTQKFDFDQLFFS
jgi:hypothetical protein